MKPTRIFASATLIVSSLALITAAGISVGDEPGIIRMDSHPPAADSAGAPMPDPLSTDNATMEGGPPEPNMGLYPQPTPYAPYFERSYGATQQLPNSAYQAPQPFGPIIMFDSNIGPGLGYQESYQRLNARIPYHIIPDTNVLIGDFSASVTNYGNPVANVGLISRNYDASLDRIFGWNAYGDYDQGYGNGDWYQVGAGLESLGKYLDFRMNGYLVVGDNSMLLSSNLSNTLQLMGNSVYKTRSQVLDNAYSGIQAEVGGPLPVLGQYGLNMYVGGYYLENGNGHDTPGFLARWQALVTQSLRVNTYLTTDDTFGTNSWVSLQYDIPNYKNRRVMRDSPVRDRLQDPVVRDNRIHVNRDSRTLNEAVINATTGLAYNILNVDPNATAAGTGTYENPYSTLQAAALANNAGVDIIRVTPRSDNTGLNLTVNGGLGLFDDQTLLSALKPLALAPDCIIPADTGLTTTLGPLISNPTMVAGGSVVRLANNDAVIGMRIDASDATGTVFGNGIVNPLPITNANVTCNIFTNYTNGALLEDVSGRIIVDENEFNGRTGTSVNGLNLTVAGGSTIDLLVRNNKASNNSGAGLSMIAQTGSTINAYDPQGTVPSGIFGNTTTGNGDGIVLQGATGSTINANVDGNTSTDNTRNGFLGETDGGVFNLYSMSGNTFSRNGQNGAFLHYLNGGVFKSVSEDLTEDLNRNGILDPGEDTNLNGVLDLANGILGPLEDVNGNGILDQGIVRNVFNNNGVAGLCIFGEDALNDGSAGMFDVGAGTGAIGAVGSGNTFIGNEAAGIAYDMTGFATGQINAVNNDIQGIVHSMAFLIDGNTFSNPWLLTNTSAQDIDITRLQIDVLPSGNIWDTTDADPGIAFVPFQPLNDSDVLTGLTSVNGTFITAGTDPLQSSAGVVLPDGGVADGTGLLDLVFNNFGPQEAFTWNLDVDPVGFPDGTTNGNDLIGSTIQLQFSDSATVGGLLQAVPGNPVAAQFVATTGIGAADGIVIRGSDNAVLQPSAILNNHITGSGRHGIDVVMTDSAQATALDIRGNSVSNNPGGGVRLNADGAAADINASVGNVGVVQLSAANSVSAANQFSNNGGTGFLALAENGGVISGNLINNTINQNGADGAALLISDGGTINFGDLLNNQVISRNQINGNAGAGLRLNSNVTPASTAELNAIVQGNTIATNAGGGIVSNLNGLHSFPPVNNTLNLTVNDANYLDLTADQNRNFITGNSDVGIGVAVGGNGLANVVLNNVSVTGTLDGADPLLNGDGIALTRADASLLTAQLDNVTSSSNTGDGLRVNAQGSDRSDPNQPLTGTANTVTINKSGFNNNGQNGAQYRIQGDAMLISDVTNSSFNNNVENGVLVQTSETSSFGDPTDGLPPGRRSIFDGNTYNENGVDGVQLIATEESRILMEITSTAVPGVSTAHPGANTAGNTSISRNGQNGVGITTTGGRSDILITSATGQTTIDGNGTTAGGNGIRWDSSGTSDGTVRVTRTIITNSVAGVTEDTATNGNGVLDPGEDLNGNGILDRGEDTNSNADIDVADGDGIQANFFDNATATLIVGGLGVGDGNTIQSNADDGIAITATGEAGSILGPPPRIPRPIISIVSNTIGGENNGIAAGNGGDGISMNVIGGTAVGVAPGDVDFTTSVPPDFSDTTVTFNGGVTEAGPIPQITINQNLISQNARKGANILLNGAGGVRDRSNPIGVFDPIRVTFTDNTIVSNGEEGIFYRADSDMNQSRFVYLPNFPDPPVTGFDNQNYSPFSPEFLAMNVGSVNGNTEYLAPYLNLRTVQNSFLTVTGNTIQDNGTGGVTGEGLFIKVGTGSYVAADIQDNVFGGNLEEDFRTASFLSAGQTFDSVDNTGDGTRDFVYLDDTAQLDVRFQNNSGNQIDADARGDIEIPTDNLALGATYSNADPLKTQFFGNIGVLRRRADLFQVENGPNLNDPNNIFESFGITQNINDNFSRSGTNYNVRAAADPLFPNIGFAPFLP